MFGFSVRVTHWVVIATTIAALPFSAGAADKDAAPQAKEEAFASGAVMDSEPG